MDVSTAALDRAFERTRVLLPDDTAAIDRVRECLKQATPTFAEIKDTVCEFYDLMGGEIMVGSRQREVAFARQMLCYFTYRYTRHTLPLIARRLGYRDHTTVHYGIRQIEKWIQTRPLVRDDVDLLYLRLCDRLLLRPVDGKDV